MSSSAAEAEALVPKFKFERQLNQGTFSLAKTARLPLTAI